MYIVPKCNNQYGIPIVLEIGSLNTRIGFAGKELPDTVVPSYVAIEQNSNIKHEIDYFNLTGRQNCDPECIVEGCFVEDLDSAHVVMEYGMGKKLLINPADHPMFFVEPVLNSREHRQKLIETLFENFQFNGIYMHKAQVLSTYLFAKQSAMIVDVGAEYTHIVPVIEGFICNKAVIRAEIGGQTLTRELHRCISEKHKVVSRYTNRASLTSSMQMFGALEVVREIKHQQCKLLEFRIENLKYNETTDKTSFELPDRTKIDLGKQLWSVPQIHFVDNPNNNYRGLQNLIYQSFQKCEPEHRKQLFSNIQVVGGGSAFPHFVERLQKQLNDNDVFGYSNKLKIFTTLDKQQKFCSSWLGASIMASMAGFDKWVISKREYEENGAIQIEKKL